MEESTITIVSAVSLIMCVVLAFVYYRSEYNPFVWNSAQVSATTQENRMQEYYSVGNFQSNGSGESGGVEGNWKDYQKPEDGFLRQQLDASAYKVTQKNGTERAYSAGNMHDAQEEGIYVDILSGEPLFSSTAKFDSGTGWPSFTRPIDEEYVTLHQDNSLFARRVEVRSRYGDNHLGHVFEDGPEPTGQRWCMNGVALKFVPRADMQAEGYGEFLSLFN